MNFKNHAINTITTSWYDHTESTSAYDDNGYDEFRYIHHHSQAQLFDDLGHDVLNCPDNQVAMFLLHTFMPGSPYIWVDTSFNFGDIS